MKPLFILMLAFGLYSTQAISQESIKENILFDTDKYQIKADELKKLEVLKQSIANKNVSSITIVGHTDSDGSLSYNEKLSKNRAEAIVNYLSKNGIDKKLINYQFQGEVKPIGSNDLDSGKQKNRRTEIIVNFKNQLSTDDFNGATSVFKINNKRDTVLAVNNKGTKIYIPKNIFEDKNGKAISGEVDIKYTAYDNSADMTFSGINMYYVQKGVSYCFNSSGMFDLKGYSNNETVKVKKGKKMQIDFALAKQNKDINFYQLEADGKNWKQVQNIPKANVAQVDNKKQNKELKGNDNKKSMYMGDFITDASQTGIQNWDQVEKILNNDGGGIDNTGKGSTLLAETTPDVDPGHSYPKIVRGLNMESFGVYNCDQIYRLQSPVNINAKYVDEDGKFIDNGTVLSLIDLNFNGAFSFAPTNFTCSATANNVLALFTKDGKLYLLEKGEFSKMNVSGGGSYTFKMKNYTNEIRNSKELANYLGI